MFVTREKMTAIYIVGGRGSGKTTLANRLSSQFALPCYEMDLIGWENGVGAQRPLAVCLREVHEIAIQADWVMEGGHRPWIDELLQSAEQIVWLDLSWNIARWRLVTRGRSKQIVLVLDQAGWHTSQTLAVPDGIHLVFLPPYSPELQPVERVFPLTNEAIANRRFVTLDDLQEVQAQRCATLQDNPAHIRAVTHFQWWPCMHR